MSTTEQVSEPDLTPVQRLGEAIEWSGGCRARSSSPFS